MSPKTATDSRLSRRDRGVSGQEVMSPVATFDFSSSRSHERIAAIAALEQEPRAFVEQTLELACEILGMDMAYVADTRLGLHDTVAVSGDAQSFGASVDQAIPLEGTYCARMLSGRLPHVVPDAKADPRVRDLEATSQADIGSYVGVPLKFSDGRVFGSFCCLSHEADPSLTERDAQFMAVLAQLLGAQLEREEAQLDNARRELTAARVDTLMAALAARDGYTEDHSQRVVAHAMAVARVLGVERDELSDLENVALLHDTGKIGISDAILHKPGKLTPDEWTEMKRHPAIGAEIVGSMPAVAHLAPAIRAEHERWDGVGYPDGLAGGAIPLASRIVLVCDAFHAMTSDRPYRAAMSESAALAELEQNAGSQFCPSVVRATLSLSGATSVSQAAA